MSKLALSFRTLPSSLLLLFFSVKKSEEVIEENGASNSSPNAAQPDPDSSWSQHSDCDNGKHKSNHLLLRTRSLVVSTLSPHDHAPARHTAAHVAPASDYPVCIRGVRRSCRIWWFGTACWSCFSTTRLVTVSHVAVCASSPSCPVAAAAAAAARD